MPIRLFANASKNLGSKCNATEPFVGTKHPRRCFDTYASLVRSRIHSVGQTEAMTKTVTLRSVFQTEASKKFCLVDEAGATTGVGRRSTEIERVTRGKQNEQDAVRLLKIQLRRTIGSTLRFLTSNSAYSSQTKTAGKTTFDIGSRSP